MSMSGLICHDDYLQKTERLSDAELGRVFRALMKYHAEKEEPELDALESMAFDFIRVDIDRTEKDYKDKCEKNRQNRLDALDKERQRSSTDVNERPQEKKRKEKEKEYEKDNTQESVREKEPHKRFTPPTVAEVDAYCRDRNNGIDAEYFVDYQTARNWILSNGKECKDWRATIRTWEKNGYNNRASPKKVNAQDDTQRDYSGEQAEAMRRMIAGLNANAG